MIEILINNKKVQVPRTLTVLQACEQHGIQIPRFCYHEQLSIAGNCRMCLVEMDKALKPIASCALEVSPGMSIWTNTLLVKKAREGVMEFLLANHPLDCPICDQGGECDLQDQAMLFGNDRGRFYEEKRSVSNKDCGPLIKTVMTRCIHCTRCVRFMSELGGYQELGTTGRGSATEIGTYVSKSIQSEVSGNIIDLCPVGALTSKPYAFTARTWELKKTETLDVLDGMGSNVMVYTSGKKPMRILPVLHEGINEEWLSDRSRFAYDGYLKQRLVSPLGGPNLSKINWRDSFNILEKNLSPVYSKNTLLLPGNSMSIEDVYSYKRLSNSLSCEVANPGLAVKRLVDFRQRYTFNSTFSGLNEADICILVGVNLKKELPLFLVRLRKEQRSRNLVVGSFQNSFNSGLEVHSLGNTFKDIFSFLEGKHWFCSAVAHSKKPMIIIGESVVKSKYVNAITQGLLNIKGLNSKGWNGLNFVEAGAGSNTLLEMGVNTPPRKKEYNTLLASGTKLDYSIDSAKVGAQIYEGSHGFSALSPFSLILPSKTNHESDSLYSNIEGRVQINKYLYNAPSLSRSIWEINSMLLNYLQFADDTSLASTESVQMELLKHINIVFNTPAYTNFYCTSGLTEVVKVEQGLLQSETGNLLQIDSITDSSKYLADSESDRAKHKVKHYI